MLDLLFCCRHHRQGKATSGKRSYSGYDQKWPPFKHMAETDAPTLSGLVSAALECLNKGSGDAVAAIDAISQLKVTTEKRCRHSV